MPGFDTVIIGGGIIGCSLARLLAGEGVKVGVIERGAPGEEASWAAAGTGPKVSTAAARAGVATNRPKCIQCFFIAL